MGSFRETDYALKDGALWHISGVGGLPPEGFVCPACGEAVGTPSGTDSPPRFLHLSREECDHRRAATLVYYARERIVRAGHITIPAVHVAFSTQKKPIALSAAKTIAIDRAETVNVSDDAIPDILLYVGGKRLLTVVREGGTVREEALERVVQSGLSAILLDPKNTSPEKDFPDSGQIFGRSSEISWICNAVAEKVLRRFIEASDRRAVIKRGTELVVDGCPLLCRHSGRRFANYISDCFCCEFFIDRQIIYKALPHDPRSYTSKEYILCTGRNHVATLRELNDYDRRREAAVDPD